MKSVSSFGILCRGDPILLTQYLKDFPSMQGGEGKSFNRLQEVLAWFTEVGLEKTGILDICAQLESICVTWTRVSLVSSRFLWAYSRIQESFPNTRCEAVMYIEGVASIFF